MRYFSGPPGARSRRTPGHDYTGPGQYFITIRTYKGDPLFGEVKHGRMYLSPYGQIVVEEWQRTEERRQFVAIDEYIAMPDHFHGLIRLRRDPERSPKGSREARLATVRSTPGLENPSPGSLSTVIGAFKSAATRRINCVRRTPGGRVWQPSFWDTIVGDRRSLALLRRYIRTNPQRWRSD